MHTCKPKSLDQVLVILIATCFGLCPAGLPQRNLVHESRSSTEFDKTERQIRWLQSHSKPSLNVIENYLSTIECSRYPEDRYVRALNFLYSGGYYVRFADLATKIADSPDESGTIQIDRTQLISLLSKAVAIRNSKFGAKQLVSIYRLATCYGDQPAKARPLLEQYVYARAGVNVFPDPSEEAHQLRGGEFDDAVGQLATIYANNRELAKLEHLFLKTLKRSPAAYPADLVVVAHGGCTAEASLVVFRRAIDFTKQLTPEDRRPETISACRAAATMLPECAETLKAVALMAESLGDYEELLETYQALAGYYFMPPEETLIYKEKVAACKKEENSLKHLARSIPVWRYHGRALVILKPPKS